MTSFLAGVELLPSFLCTAILEVAGVEEAFFVALLNKILLKLRFIARHIIWVSKRPEAPTMPPTDTVKISPVAIPAIEAATPEVELSSDIVIGISAPPTLIAKTIPKIKLIRVPKVEAITKYFITYKPGANAKKRMKRIDKVKQSIVHI